VIGFCSWQEGLVLTPELADGISGIKDAVRRGLRLVNREQGAEARSVLDRELAGAGVDASQVPGYDTQATGHLEVAAAIAAGLADAGIASEPAALAYGLAFVPLDRRIFRPCHPGRASRHPRSAGPAESPLIGVAAGAAGQRARI
jgi:putative molybdopterin biosynthesis protein